MRIRSAEGSIPAAAGPLGASVPRPISASGLGATSPKLLGSVTGVGSVPGSTSRVVVASGPGGGRTPEERAWGASPITGVSVASAGGTAASVTASGMGLLRVGLVWKMG